MRHWIILCSLFWLFLAQSTSAQQDDELIPITADNFDQIVPLYSLSTQDGIRRSSSLNFNQAGTLLQVENYVVDLTTFETFMFPDATVSLSYNHDQVNINWDKHPNSIYDVPAHQLNDTTNPYISESINHTSPSGRYTIINHNRLVDLEQNQEVQLSPSRYVSQPLFSHDERYLKYRDNNQETHIFDLDTMRLVYSIDNIGKYFFVEGTDYLVNCHSHISLIHRETGQIVDRIPATNTCTPSQDGHFFFNHREGTNLYTSSDNLAYHLYRIVDDTFEHMDTLYVPYSRLITFSPDNNLIVFGLYTNTSSNMRVYNREIGSFLSDIPYSFYRMTFSNDSRIIFSSSSYGTDYTVWLHDGDRNIKPFTELQAVDAILDENNTTLVIYNGATLLFYGIETPTRQRQPLLVRAYIAPSSVNIRAEPKFDSEIIATAQRGMTFVGGTQDGYFYLPDYEGWVLADPQYIRLPNMMTVDDFIGLEIVKNFDEIITEIDPTNTTQAPAYQALDLTTISSDQPIDLSDNHHPIEPSNNLTQITTDNASEIQLLDIIPFRGSVLYDSIRSINNQTNEIILTEFLKNDLIYYNYDTLAQSTISPVSGVILYNPTQIINDIVYFIDAAQSIFKYYIETHTYSHITSGRTFIISSDGELMLISPLTDETVYLLDLNTQEKIMSFDLNSYYLGVFANQSPYVALAASDNNIYIMDTQTGETLHQIYNNSTVSSIVFSPDDSQLIIHWDKQITMYSLEQSAILWGITDAEKPRTIPINFSRDGSVVLGPVWVAYKYLLLVVETTTGDILRSYELLNYANYDLSPDGQLLAISNPFIIYDLSTGEILLELPYNLTNGEPYFTPDATSLIVPTSDSLLLFGIADENRPVWTGITGRIVPSSISVRAEPDPNSPIIGSASGEVLITGRYRNSMLYLEDHGGWVWNDSAYIQIDDQLKVPPLIQTQQ